MAERCPTCGQTVRVVSDCEGTSHYEAARMSEDWRREWNKEVAVLRRVGSRGGSWAAAILAADAALKAAERERDALRADMDVWRNTLADNECYCIEMAGQRDDARAEVERLRAAAKALVGVLDRDQFSDETRLAAECDLIAALEGQDAGS